MTVLVIGTSNSGKSELAERLAMETGDPCRIYLATMKVCDDEAKERVLRHREQRRGRGFETIELMYNICDVLDAVEKPSETTILLECVSNLVGNEIYDSPKGKGISYFLPEDTSLCGEKESLHRDISIRARKEEFADRIAADIKKISEKVHNLIIVTNEYEIRGDFDDETRVYVQLLKMVGERISTFSDKVYDVRKGQK